MKKKDIEEVVLGKRYTLHDLRVVTIPIPEIEGNILWKANIKEGETIISVYDSPNSFSRIILVAKTEEEDVSL